MSRTHWSETLKQIGIERPAVEPYAEFDLPGGKDKCWTWHFSFEGLLRHGDGAKAVRKVVNQIDTAYRLQASETEEKFTAQQLQSYLFEAAQILVRNDTDHLKKACQWFVDMGFKDIACRREAGLSK